MRLKYQSLIALGISTVILSGCTTTGGGFLNLGVADALKKTKANLFKQRLGYTKTPIGNTGLSLPTFGTQPTLASGGPQIVDSYTIPQGSSAIPQGTSAPINSSDCGCNAGVGDSTVISTQEYYMPEREYIQETAETLPSEVMAPPVDSVPSELLPDAELPKVNQLPLGNDDSENKVETQKGFDNLDTEGTFAPLGQLEENDVKENDVDESEVNEIIADGQSESDQSIFETAQLKKRAALMFDTVKSQKVSAADDQNTKMLTLHARPAQSHNVFDQEANKRRSLETMQASHKRNYRQQNDLRQKPSKLQGPSYRQARNTNQEIDFKPLPPVTETSPVPALQPEAKQAPLPKSEDQRDELQNSKTRTANATNNQTAKTSPRVPILRATTVSTASILSLKNLANVIEDNKSQQKYYETNRHTAQGTTSGPIDVLNASETTIER